MNGKRPWATTDGKGNPCYRWGYEGINEDHQELPPTPDYAMLPYDVYNNLPDDPVWDICVQAEFRTEAEAIVAAEAAYRKTDMETAS